MQHPYRGYTYSPAEDPSLNFYLSNEQSLTDLEPVPDGPPPFHEFHPQWPSPPHPFPRDHAMNGMNHPIKRHHSMNGYEPNPSPYLMNGYPSHAANGFNEGVPIHQNNWHHHYPTDLPPPDPRSLFNSQSAPEMQRPSPLLEPQLHPQSSWRMLPPDGRFRAQSHPSTNHNRKPYIDDSVLLDDPLFTDTHSPSHSPMGALPSVPHVPGDLSPGMGSEERNLNRSNNHNHHHNLNVNEEKEGDLCLLEGRDDDELLVFGFMRHIICNRLQTAIRGFIRRIVISHSPLLVGILDLNPMTRVILNFCHGPLTKEVPILSEVVDKICRLYARRCPQKFASKFTNHAKGNFYISKEMIKVMMVRCHERFDTDVPNDEKSAFGYYKESVAMQINDGQIDEVVDTIEGPIIIIHIDLHFKEDEKEVMYLIAKENDQEYVHKVRWCISDFATKKEIFYKYGVHPRRLPTSSRLRPGFQDALKRPPRNVPIHVIWSTDFKHLPAKTSKRQTKDGKAVTLKKTRIRLDDLKYFVQKSWGDSLTVPVVVIKGKKQWIEWKRFVQLTDSEGMEQWVGISLRYYSANRQWKIECMDYDAGRIYYQHRLVGPTRFQCKFADLAGRITTSLDIYKR